MNLGSLKEQRKLINCNRQKSVSVIIPQTLLKLLQWEPGMVVNVGLNQTMDGVEINLKK